MPAVLLCAALLAPSRAGAVTITATPSSGLQPPSAQVQVDVTGLSGLGSSYEVVQVARGPGYAYCNLRMGASAPTPPVDQFAVSHQLAMITPLTNRLQGDTCRDAAMPATVACDTDAAAGRSCALEVVDLATGQTLASTPIVFAPPDDLSYVCSVTSQGAELSIVPPDNPLSLGLRARWWFPVQQVYDVSHYRVVDTRTGETVTVPRQAEPNPDDIPNLTSWLPRHLGTYQISATYFRHDCVQGARPQRVGPLTASATFTVVRPPPAVWNHDAVIRCGRLIGSGPRGTAAEPCPRGVALLRSHDSPEELCGGGARDYIRFTAVIRYTVDGTRPDRRSPVLENTHNCLWFPPPRRRSGRWGWVQVQAPADASAVATPGSRLRVWIEWRGPDGIVKAIRARARTRHGVARWVRDRGRCPGAPVGCSPLRHRKDRVIRDPKLPGRHR